MRRRIVSLLCVVAVLAAMLSVCIVTTLADDSVKLAEPITGTLNADDWDTPANISADGYLIAPNSTGVKTVNSVVNYNLGLKWDTSLKLLTKQKYQNGGGNISLKIGELEVTLYNVWYDKTKPAGSRIIKNAYIELKAAGVSAGTYDLGPEVGAIEVLQPLGDYLALSYDNGAVTVNYGTADDNTAVITKTVDGLDFSNVGITLSVKGNYVPDFLQIQNFNLSSAGVYDVDTPPVSVDVSGDLDAADWNGDTDCIKSVTDGAGNTTVRFCALGNNVSIRTLTSINSYTLFDKWESSILIGDTWNDNASGQPYVLKIGTLEAIVYNSKGNKTTQTANAAMELKKDGVSVKKLELPANIGTNGAAGGGIGGLLKMTYDNGTVTVSYRNNTITEDVGTIDFSNVTATLSIQGNWAGSINVRDFTLKSDAPVTSSEPESSVPVSSEPASSVPASSEPVSSEPASSVPASSEPASSEPASSEVTSSETEPEAVKVTTPISGELVAEDWDPSDKIVDGKFRTQEDQKIYTITSVKKYDLGTDWASSITITHNTNCNNCYGQPFVLKVGDLEAVLYNCKYNSGSKAVTQNAYIALKVNGEEVAKYDLGDKVGTFDGATGFSGLLTLKYKDGAVTVSHKDNAVITFDASASALDFSNTEISISLMGNWVRNGLGVSAFSLTTADCNTGEGEGEEGGEGVKGDPIETIENGVFNATDWEGAVEKIRADGALYTGSGSADIFSVKSYDLSGGFKFASKLVMKNGYNNFGGEYCAMYVGEPGTGLELRIKQDNEGRGTSAFYNGYIYYGGEKVATVDLLNDPNGTYEIRYSGGKVSVYLKDTAIAWTLADGSTSTSVTLDNPDFNNVKLGFNIKGNWHPSDRYWMGYSLAPLGSSGGNGAGGTGDTRNIVVPVCVMVASVCALAFVLTRKKSRT